MTAALKITAIIVNADNTVAVQYSHGTVPLPQSASGESQFETADALYGWASGIELNEEQMLRLHLASTLFDAAGQREAITAPVDQTLMFDPYNGVNPLVIG
jgi:hypothetical protein